MLKYYIITKQYIPLLFSKFSSNVYTIQVWSLPRKQRQQYLITEKVKPKIRLNPTLLSLLITQAFIPTVIID